jgi:hypothetical protein
MLADQIAQSFVGERSPHRRRAEQCSTAPTHAAVLALQRTAGNRAVARWVGKQASSSGWKYYSSFEPHKLYDTKPAATAADRRLEEDASGSQTVWEAMRAFTLYTYTNVNPRNQLGLTTQGPHVVSHVNVSGGLANRETREELRETFAQLVPEPSAFERQLREERGTGGKSLNLNYERAVDDYGEMYASTKRALETPSMNIGYARHLIGGLLNLLPYATYGWKTGKAVSAKARAGKGESPDKFNLDDRGRWTYPERKEAFVSMLRTWWEKKRPQFTSDAEDQRAAIVRPRRASVSAPDPRPPAASSVGPMVLALVSVVFALWWIFSRG